jgi:integrase
MKHKLITENPASCLGNFYSQAKAKHEKIEPLTVEEVPLFLAEVQRNRYTKKHYVLFLVERSFERTHRKIVPTKTKKHRRVDLSDEALEALSALRKTRLEEWFKRGKERLIARGLWDDALNVPRAIFCSEIGGYMDRDNINRRHFHSCLANAGLKRRRFHDLRHHADSVIMPTLHPDLAMEAHVAYLESA